MKIWLDDIRPAPEGWTHVKNFNEFKLAIENRDPHVEVEAISFDNDLGVGQREGWEIANWLRDRIFGEYLKLPNVRLHVHSWNIVAGPRIKRTIQDIYNFQEEQRITYELWSMKQKEIGGGHCPKCCKSNTASFKGTVTCPHCKWCEKD